MAHKTQLPNSWQIALAACVQKRLYALQQQRLSETPFLQRWLAYIKGGLLKNPFKDIPIEGMALRYVQLYNQERAASNIYINDSTDQRISSRMRYDADTYMPVLSITFNDGNCFFQMRKRFDEKANYEELGISYPYSESGVTGVPKDMTEELKPFYDMFRTNLLLIRSVIETAPAIDNLG